MRLEKKQLINDIGAILEKSDFVYMTSYKGLKVKDFEQLRIQLEKSNAGCHVLKNTMIRKAAELKGISELAAVKLAGDTALISGNGDAGAVAKILSNYFKKFNFLGFKAGYLDGKVLNPTDMEEISQLPSKEILYAQLLGLLQAPARNLVSVLNAKLASPVYLLSAIKEKKSKS